ncbi:hypothetical protein [Thermofilum sp.]
MERRKQTILEPYIRLALRNYLRSNGYALNVLVEECCGAKALMSDIST